VRSRNRLLSGAKTVCARPIDSHNTVHKLKWKRMATKGSSSISQPDPKSRTKYSRRSSSPPPPSRRKTNDQQKRGRRGLRCDGESGREHGQVADGGGKAAEWPGAPCLSFSVAVLRLAHSSRELWSASAEDADQPAAFVTELEECCGQLPSTGRRQRD